MCPRAGKLWGYIGVGGENCGGIWSKNGRKLTIYPRTFILGAYSLALFGAVGVVSCSFPSTDFVFRASVIRAQELGSSRGYTTQLLVVGMVCSGQSTPSDGGDRPDARPAVAGGFACGSLPGDDAVDSSAWDHADICLPGIYFPCLPRSRARKHRARTQLPSYHPVDALVYGRGVVLQG